MPDIRIEWEAPIDKSVVDSLAIYRYEGITTDCSILTSQGTALAEDLPNDSNFYNDFGTPDFDQVTYGIFSKNQTGLSPCSLASLSIDPSIAAAPSNLTAVYVAAKPVNGPTNITPTVELAPKYGVDTGIFVYPLFLTETESDFYDSQFGGSGTSHTMTYNSVTYYMPDNGGTHAGTQAPIGVTINGNEFTYSQIVTGVELGNKPSGNEGPTGLTSVEETTAPVNGPTDLTSIEEIVAPTNGPTDLTSTETLASLANNSTTAFTADTTSSLIYIDGSPTHSVNTTPEGINLIIADLGSSFTFTLTDPNGNSQLVSTVTIGQSSPQTDEPGWELLVPNWNGSYHQWTLVNSTGEAWPNYSPPGEGITDLTAIEDPSFYERVYTANTAPVNGQDNWVEVDIGGGSTVKVYNSYTGPDGYILTLSNNGYTMTRQSAIGFGGAETVWSSNDPVYDNIMYPGNFYSGYGFQAVITPVGSNEIGEIKLDFTYNG